MFPVAAPPSVVPYPELAVPLDLPPLDVPLDVPPPEVPLSLPKMSEKNFETLSNSPLLAVEIPSVIVVTVDANNESTPSGPTRLSGPVPNNTLFFKILSSPSLNDSRFLLTSLKSIPIPVAGAAPTFPPVA